MGVGLYKEAHPPTGLTSVCHGATQQAHSAEILGSAGDREATSAALLCVPLKALHYA